MGPGPGPKAAQHGRAGADGRGPGPWAHMGPGPIWATFENLHGPFENLQGPFENIQGPFENIQGPFENIQGPSEGIQGPSEGIQVPSEGIQGPKLGPKFGPTIRAQNWSHDFGSQAKIPGPRAPNRAHGLQVGPYLIHPAGEEGAPSPEPDMPPQGWALSVDALGVGMGLC